MKKITWVMIIAMIASMLGIFLLTTNFNLIEEHAPINASDVSTLLFPVLITYFLIYGAHISILAALLTGRKNNSVFKANLFDKIVYWINVPTAFPFGLINALILHQKTSGNKSSHPR